MKSVEKLSEYNSFSSLSNIYLFKLSLNIDITTIAKKYTEDLNVEYAEPNYLYHLCMTYSEKLQYNKEMFGTLSSGFIPDDKSFMELNMEIANYFREKAFEKNPMCLIVDSKQVDYGTLCYTISRKAAQRNQFSIIFDPSQKD